MDSIIQRNEIKIFWRCAGQLRAARRGNAPAPEIADLVDEIEVIEKYTDSDALRARCRAVLAEGAVVVAATAG